MLAIYTRLSKEDEESNSIENQTREGKAFAKANGFHEYELYNEGKGVSGGVEIKDRPQLFRLLKDMRSDKIKAVWFRHQNRLERNSTTFVIFTGEAKKNRVHLFFGDKEYDYNDPQNVLFGGITSAISQYQKDLQSTQTKKTLIDNAQEGKVWSIVAYGYKSDGGYLAVNDNEVEVVKRIYRESLQGIGTDRIAKRLNKDNIPTRRGAEWRGRTVQGIIKNTLYKGERVYGGRRFEAPKIIEPELWQKVNDNLVNNRNNSGKRVEHKYLLKGLITCGTCGKGYYGKVKKKNDVINENTYTCVGKRYPEIKCKSRSINRPTLDLVIKTMFLTPTLKEIYLNYLNTVPENDKLEELNESLKELQKQLLANNKEKNNLLDKVAKGIMDDEFIKSKIDSIKASRESITLQINNTKEQIDRLSNLSNDVEASIEKIDKVDANLSHNEWQELLKENIEKITLYYSFQERSFALLVNLKLIDDEILIALPQSMKEAHIFGGRFAWTIDNLKDSTELKLTRIEVGEGITRELLKKLD
ncbi:MAG: hypothetical protein DCO96_06540 [Fluviicola sp. XM-24bin1]|nr:MAG: hypothetical protein DCO96_06540 [Fluviicola sp. XM-24bin1]